MTLGKRLIQRAITMNPIYQRKIGFSYNNVDTPEFANETAEFQKRAGLLVDGIMGYDTYELKHGVKLLTAVDYIVLGGQRVPVTFPVVSFNEDHGFGFYEIGKGYCNRHKNEKLKKVVLHWPVTRSSKQTFHALTRRILADDPASTHFDVNYDSVLYQFGDPFKHVMYHAAGFNRNTIGIDLTNPVYAKYSDEHDLYPRQVLMPGDWGISFQEKSAFYNGFCGYTDAQLETTYELLKVLCPASGIPRTPPPMKYRRQQLPDVYSHEGVVGHREVDKARKWDTIYGHHVASGMLAWEYLTQ